MKRLLLIAALLIACDGTEDRVDTPTEPVQVTAHVDRSEPVPGRPFELSITVNKGADVQFDLPDIGSEIQGLVVQKQRTEGPERVGDREVSREIYTLKAPLSGVYRIPGVEAPYLAPGDVVGTAGTAPILIEAGRHGDAESTGDEVLRNLKPPAPPDPDPRPWVAAAVVGAVLAALLAALLLRRRRNDRPERPIPPHEQALRELQHLLEGDLLRANDQGPFAYEVSAILRRYLEGRYAFPAWRMTTPEVLRALPREVAVQRDIEASIRAVLEASDFVKFAAQAVPVETLRSWGASVRTVVDATTPAPEEAV